MSKDPKTFDCEAPRDEIPDSKVDEPESVQLAASIEKAIKIIFFSKNIKEGGDNLIKMLAGMTDNVNILNDARECFQSIIINKELLDSDTYGRLKTAFNLLRLPPTEPRQIQEKYEQLDKCGKLYIRSL